MAKAYTLGLYEKAMPKDLEREDARGKGGRI